MTRPTRMVLFALAAAGVAVMIGLALPRMPVFGGARHPYRDHAVAAAVRENAPNVVSSVNFDQRGLDTLGEESILLASVMGVTVLLRRAEDEEEVDKPSVGRILDATELGGYVLLPVTVVIGLDVVAHGHLTPGGGFQGGVVLGTALHLTYVAGRYRTLRRLSPTPAFEWGEALGSGAFACLGVAGVAATGAFLANIIPTGSFGTLFSGGTVPLLNGAVGIEAASGTMVLLSKFLEQALVIRRREAGQ